MNVLFLLLPCKGTLNTPFGKIKIIKLNSAGSGIRHISYTSFCALVLSFSEAI